jgi:hypothetical protein
MIWKLPKLKCNEKKDFKKEQNIQEWWDNWISSKLMPDTKPQMQEVHRMPSQE